MKKAGWGNSRWFKESRCQVQDILECKVKNVLQFLTIEVEKGRLKRIVEGFGKVCVKNLL